MPIVRGRFLPEIESTGRLKKCLDVLLWGNDWTRQNLIDLDEVEVLRDYLRSIRPSFCGIRLFVPTAHAGSVELLERLSIKFVSVLMNEVSKHDRKPRPVFSMLPSL